MLTERRLYDGVCRGCGSPTINGLHQWGWTNCKNYRQPLDAIPRDESGEKKEATQ